MTGSVVCRLLRLGGSSVGIRAISDMATPNATRLCPIDTLALAKKLEKQGFEPKQAQVITEVLMESVDNASASFASKTELSMFKAEMKNSQDNDRVKFQHEMEKMNTELRFQIEKAAAEQILDYELKCGIQCRKLHDELIDKNQETIKVTSKLEREIHAL